MAPRCAPHDSEGTSWVGVLQLYGSNSYGPKSSPYPVSRALPGDAVRKSMALRHALGDTARTSLGRRGGGGGGSYGSATHASSLRRASSRRVPETTLSPADRSSPCRVSRPRHQNRRGRGQDRGDLIGGPACRVR